MRQVHLLGSDPLVPIPAFRDYLYNKFPFYRSALKASGAAALSTDDGILDQCPILTRDGYHALEEDVRHTLGSRQFLTDLSSGTTGPHRTRYTTVQDDDAEAALCRRFFNQCGLGSGDQVLALDVGNPDLYLFYGDVLRASGVELFAFANITADFDQSRQVLRINPTAIVTIPSVLRRILPLILEMIDGDRRCRLTTIVYLGETMPSALRAALEQHGLQVYGLYGSTEIGSVAGECNAHCGMHIYNDAVVPTVLDAETNGTRIQGEVVWTTLHFRDHPLLKYATGDLVEIDTEACICGLSSPRLLSVKRVQDEFIIYGHKFEHSLFLEALAAAEVHTPFLQILLAEAGAGIKIAFLLPEELEDQAFNIERTLGDVDEMPYFVDLGFVEYECRFSQGPIDSKRKLKNVVDERG